VAGATPCDRHAVGYERDNAIRLIDGEVDPNAPVEVKCDEAAVERRRSEMRHFATTADPSPVSPGALEFDGARAANEAFKRALRLQPPSEQVALRSREMERLDALTARICGREDLIAEEVEPVTCVV
jgi:hypothetical protein